MANSSVEHKAAWDRTLIQAILIQVLSINAFAVSAAKMSAK
jgi:hypothetical protein